MKKSRGKANNRSSWLTHLVRTNSCTVPCARVARDLTPVPIDCRYLMRMPLFKKSRAQSAALVQNSCKLDRTKSKREALETDRAVCRPEPMDREPSDVQRLQWSIPVQEEGEIRCNEVGGSRTRGMRLAPREEIRKRIGAGAPV